MSYGHLTKIPRDDGLLSEPTTEVNGNDPYCKSVGQRMVAVHTVRFESKKMKLLTICVNKKCL